MYSEIRVISVASAAATIAMSNSELRISKPDEDKCSNIVRCDVILTNQTCHEFTTTFTADSPQQSLHQQNAKMETSLQTHDNKRLMLQPTFFTNASNEDNISLFAVANKATASTATSAAANGSEEDYGCERPRTPTSRDQRIPEIKLCPPAPRKPKSKPVRKRKICTDTCCHGGAFRASKSASKLLDFSKEVESMYPPHLQVNFGRKIKKARSV